MNPSKEIEDELDRGIASHRAEHFAFEIKPSKYLKGGIAISFTTNGTQWESVGWTREEANTICSELAKYLSNL